MTGKEFCEAAPFGLLNSLIEGDCLIEMKKIPDSSIDMVLCDLPYGITQNKWDSVIPLDELWKEYDRIVKPNGVIALTSQGVFTGKLIMSNPKMFKYKWVWKKSKVSNFLNSKKQPMRQHEDVCIFYKKQPTYNPQMTKGEPYDKGVRDVQSGNYGFYGAWHSKNDEGWRYPTDVIYVKTSECEGKVWHPTQKPVELGRYFIRTYTNPGEIVLDNASGSGSFLISAMLEGRNFIGIEKNENVFYHKTEKINFIDVTRERMSGAWNKMDEEKKVYLENSGLIKEFQEDCNVS